MAISKVVYGNTTLIDISQDTVAAAALLSGITAHGSNGESVTGNIASKSSADVIVAGPTVSIPSGYYAADVSKTIPISVDNHRLVLPEGLISVG